MDRSGWLTVVSSIVSAILGGSLALLGAILVSCRELIRNARVRMFDELLPIIRRLNYEDLRQPYHVARPTPLPDFVESPKRCAVLAGRRESKLVASFIDALSERRAFLEVHVSDARNSVAGARQRARAQQRLAMHMGGASPELIAEERERNRRIDIADTRLDRYYRKLDRYLARKIR
jgi:hypothetical protein